MNLVGDDAYSPSDESFRLVGNKKLEQRITNVRKNNPEQSDEIENELKGIQGYNEFISHLSGEMESSIIWFLKLNQDSRKEFLRQFNEIELDSKKEYKIILSKGKVKTDKIEYVAPPIPISNPEINISGTDVFVDNKSNITSTIQSSIDKFIEDVKLSLSIMKSYYSEYKVQVKSFTIGASSSRFRNTGEAQDLTWAELSSRRAKNVSKEIIGRLGELGIIVPKGVIELKLGENGDGTSGPNPGKNDEGKQYAISKDGTYDNFYTKIKSEELNRFGAPLPSKSDYNQFKWLIVDCEIEMIPKVQPYPSFDENKVGEYNMVIKQYEEPGTLKRFKPNIPKLKSGKVDKKGKNKLTICPDFESKGIKIKDEWWKNLGNN